MDRGASRATVHGVAESDTTERRTLAIVEDDKNKIIMFSKLSEMKMSEYIKNNNNKKQPSFWFCLKCRIVWFSIQGF